MADDPTIEEALARLKISGRKKATTFVGGDAIVPVFQADLTVLLASHASLEERVKEAKRLMKPFVAVVEDYIATFGYFDGDKTVMGRIPREGGTPPVVTGADISALAAFVNEKET